MPGCRAGPWLSFFPDPSPHGPFLPQLRLPVPTTRIMEIAILFALILLNGVFAMSEIALVTARKARLQKLIDEGDAGAAAAAQLGADPTRFLSTIQIGITSIGVLNGIVGEAALAAPPGRVAAAPGRARALRRLHGHGAGGGARSEKHTAELQSPCNLVCRLLL